MSETPEVLHRLVPHAGDDGFEITATGSTGPDPDSFDGTVSVTVTKVGMNPTARPSYQ